MGNGCAPAVLPINWREKLKCPKGHDLQAPHGIMIIDGGQVFAFPGYYVCLQCREIYGEKAQEKEVVSNE